MMLALAQIIVLNSRMISKQWIGMAVEMVVA